MQIENARVQSTYPSLLFLFIKDSTQVPFAGAFLVPRTLLDSGRVFDCRSKTHVFNPRTRLFSSFSSRIQLKCPLQVLSSSLTRVQSTYPSLLFLFNKDSTQVPFAGAFLVPKHYLTVRYSTDGDSIWQCVLPWTCRRLLRYIR